MPDTFPDVFQDAFPDVFSAQSPPNGGDGVDPMFCGFLRHNTNKTVIVGPFLDATDGVTPETGLSLEFGQDNLHLSKNGGTFGNISDLAVPHRSNGTYALDLAGLAEVDQVGMLTLLGTPAGARQVRQDWMVLPADAYDQMVAGTKSPGAVRATTVASVTSQTQIVLAAGPDFDDALKYQLVMFEDVTNSNYESLRAITAYDGSTKTITLDSAADFTIAANDRVIIYPRASLESVTRSAISQEAVPRSRVARLRPTPTGLRSEHRIELTAGTDVDVLCAADFSADLPTNGRVVEIVSVSLHYDQSGGLTVDTPTGTGVDHSLAKFRLTAITIGRYTVRVVVTYDNGQGTRTGDVWVDVN